MSRMSVTFNKISRTSSFYVLLLSCILRMSRMPFNKRQILKFIIKQLDHNI